MTAMRKLVRAQINALGDDEVEVVMSTDALARDGHILIPQGCVLDNYRANPIVLWSHNPDNPVGNAENIDVGPDQLSARIRFAPPGISPKADEVRGLMKAGVIRAVSVGFDPIEMEPLDPKKPRGGQRISRWELLELSPVSVPADPGAVVTARSNDGDASMVEAEKVGADAPARRANVTRTNAVRSGAITFKRGLYQVAQLCYLFEELGWHVDMAKYESAIEGDASKVPGMLAATLNGLGDALLAMTAEEIKEAITGLDVEPCEDDDADDDILIVEERRHIAAASSPAVRMFRRGLAQAKLRAGKTLSADTVKCLQEAKGKHEEAMDLHRSAMRCHSAGMAAVDDMMDRAGVSDSGDPATETIQESDGTQVDEGSRMSPDFRRRQVEALALGVSV
ncbi:MAG: HK97 family phage prohead protease [Caulobacteraceae bacterium]